MNTVKHYKDLGLEFVEGDEVDNDADNEGKDIKPLSEVMAVSCNEGKYGFDYAPVGEFAWRKNTGEKPAYKGEIEVKHRDGGVRTDAAAMQEWGICNHIGDIIFWRPLPIKPEQQEKPIFTQEMADANELVPLGAEFMACGSKWICSALHVKGGVIGENQIEELRRFSITECTPVKTQRDIEIDMIADLALYFCDKIETPSDIDALYNEGYRVTKVEE